MRLPFSPDARLPSGCLHDARGRLSCLELPPAVLAGVVDRRAAGCTGATAAAVQELLRAEGVTDFSKYAPAATGPLAGDFFVPDEVFARTETEVARTFG